MRVKTRMAPSPTGYLHVGTARTTLFNFLFARHMGGEFILRIEDTDLERSDKNFEEDIIEGLKWLGIEWDGEITRQSERIDIYEKYLEKILAEGKAFYCPHSQEELDEERKRQVANKFSPQHTCDAREKKLTKGLIRFKNDADKIIRFKDEIRGEIEFDPALLGDFSLAKNLRTPLYNFAVVVDDAVMEITHVIRGEDHISNTPKQILIEEALGFPQPIFAHLPLLLGRDRSKLSKRHGATSIREYKNEGYLPDALFNFLALLGWNPGGEQEIFSTEELVKIFSLDRVQGAGAIFDMTKLDWMNGEYIRRKSASVLTEDSIQYFVNAGLLEPEFLQVNQTSIRGYMKTPALVTRFKNNSGNIIELSYIEKVVALEQPRLKKLSELAEKTDYFFREPEYDAELLNWKKMSKDEIIKSLEASKELLEDTDDVTKENLEKIFMTRAAEFKDRGELLWPLRVALSGKKFSPGPFEIMSVLGKETSISRVSRAISMLK